MTALHFDISGLGVRLQGVPRPLGVRLCQHWARFRASQAAEAFLDVEVDVRGRPMSPSTFMDRDIVSTFEAGRARFEVDEGSIELGDAAEAGLRLAPGDAGRQYWGLINLLAAATGWRMPLRRGAAVHAAGILLEGRAFLLVGPAGSGKTTWARLAEDAGADVLSDDLVVVDGAGDAVRALSTPFRADDFRPVGPGRWPVAAILLAAQGHVASLAPVSRLTITARLTANLFYLAGALPHDSRGAAVVEHLASAVPGRILTFAPDASFLDELRRFAVA